MDLVRFVEAAGERFAVAANGSGKIALLIESVALLTRAVGDGRGVAHRTDDGARA